MKLTNQEIARVFAMYLGCEVCMNDLFTYTRKLDAVIVDGVSIDIHEAVTYGKKLILTPLDKITDEDAVKVAKIAFGYLGNEKKSIYYGNEVINFHYLNIGWTQSEFDTAASRSLISEIRSQRLINVFQFLISRGYSVPLWFGIDHPCNGKTAIELEIAIDRTLQTKKI